MKFCEKLKGLRREKGISQQAFAEIIGVSYRAYQNYEAGKAYPRQTSVYSKIAAEFGVSVDYLLSEEDKYIIDARERGGASSADEVNELVSRVGGLFAGGELSQDDKDKVLRAITELYWEAKEKSNLK